MGYDQIDGKMSKEPYRPGALREKLIEEDNVKYISLVDEFVKVGSPVKLTMDYLGISPRSTLLGKILNKDMLLQYAGDNNVIIAVRTVLRIREKYRFDMKYKPWLYYDYCFDKYTFQGTDTTFLDIAYIAYKLDKKHKFIESDFDECREAAISLIAAIINKMPFSFTNADIIRVWHLMNIFGNSVNDNQLFESYISNSFCNNLTDSLCNLYYNHRNNGSKVLVEYLSSCSKYVGIMDLLVMQELEEKEMRREFDYKANLKIDQDNLICIIKQVLHYFKFRDDDWLLGYMVNQFDHTFDFERGVYEEAIAAWATLRLSGSDSYIEQVKRYTPWDLYDFGDTLYTIDNELSCWSALYSYGLCLELQYDEWFRELISSYFKGVYKTFTLNDLLKFIAYVNVTYDIDKPDKIGVLLNMADDHMREDVNDDWLKQSRKRIDAYGPTILSYQVRAIELKFEHCCI